MDELTVEGADYRKPYKGARWHEWVDTEWVPVQRCQVHLLDALLAEKKKVTKQEEYLDNLRAENNTERERRESAEGVLRKVLDEGDGNSCAIISAYFATEDESNG